MRKIKDFLKNQKIFRLATINNSAPHVVPMWYVIYDNFIYFSADSDSRKIKNIKQNNIVSALFDSGEELYEVKGVLIQGEAKIEKDQKKIKAVRRAYARKYFGSEKNEIFKKFDRYIKNQIFVKISMKKMISWDYTRMRS